MQWLGLLSAILVFPDLTQCVRGLGVEGCLLVAVFFSSKFTIDQT